MERWVGKVAIVTGASAGIGLAIVESLVDAGMKVAGLARSKEKLNEVARKLRGRRGEFHPFSADVSKESEVLDAFRWVTENIGAVHVLVNNVGIARPGSLLDGLTEHWDEVLHTNVLGLCVATREASKVMRENHIEGHIVHINSTMGHRVYNIPGFNLYTATKHAVTALTETLRQELVRIGSKIKISSISPGYVKSEFFVGKQWPTEFVEVLKSSPNLEVEDVANAVLYVLGTPPHVQVHELIIQPVGEAC